MDSIELLRVFKQWIEDHLQYEVETDTIEHYEGMLVDINRIEIEDKRKRKEEEQIAREMAD